MSERTLAGDNPAPKRAPGRNIVLCTDGTGNSASAASKSNVWRLYQALQLNSPDQIAFYVRGVGTSGIKVLQILGGVFGFGLASNVRTLYQFLCENYRPPSASYEGDRIYIFGFSRGAFTARLLAGLITHCGILDPSRQIRKGNKTLAISSKQGMRHAVRIAYASLRIAATPHSPLPTRITRWLRDLCTDRVPQCEKFWEQYSYPADLHPLRDNQVQTGPIEALGVWDTVSAYGMPITELSIMLDKAIFAHRFEDHVLHPSINRAFHALAIDDERYSFHPIVFDENVETDPTRITQVWFPGMHSDVGGGYPDASLALVSLNWMIDCVKRNGQGVGLDFNPIAEQSLEAGASCLGPMHNSRSGPAIYYRLAPRIIATMAAHKHPETPLVAMPKIHRGVFDRIRQGVGGYAPLCIPTRYEVVEHNGSVSACAAVETQMELSLRGARQERVLDQIFWRRCMYLFSSAVTILLFAVPLLAGDNQVCATGILTQLTPSFTHHFLHGWCSNPQWVLILGSLLIGTALWSIKVKTNTDQNAEFAWQHLRPGNRDKPGPEPSAFEWLSGRLRNNPSAVKLYRVTTAWITPYLALVGFLYCLVKWGIPALWSTLTTFVLWVGDGLLAMLHWLPLL